MNEDRPRRRQRLGIGERLIGEEQPFLRANLEGAQAEAAGTVAAGELRVRGVAVPGRAHGCAYAGREVVRNAVNAIGRHDRLRRNVVPID